MGTLKKKNHWTDQGWLGFLLGVLIPLLAFYLYYRLKFRDMVFIDLIKSLHEYRLLFKVMSLSVLADLPLFYLFLQFKHFKSSRGVVMACFLFAFLVLGYRIFN
ncbi:MAG: hypothetical protein JXR22_05185 [Prolixibacteraceae bacterium]|nr:hypothetical protein [Prolixibacteraceae bacterium]